MLPAFSRARTFLASGIGAATRAASDKLRDVVSVKDFGAKGDGTTDDTAPFEQAAVASANVFVPAGTYLIEDVATPAGVTFYGDGDGSVLKLKAQGALIFRPFFRVSGSSTAWRNLKFDGNRAAHSQDGWADSFANGGGVGRSNRAGILADGAYRGLVVDGCSFEEMYGASVATRGADRIRVTRCRFTDCNYEGFFAVNANWPTPLDGAEVTDCQFENIYTGDGTVQANCSLISGFQNILVSRNVGKEFERNLVKLENAIHAIVDGNRIESNRTDTFNCLQLQVSGRNVRFSNNVIRNVKAGIYVNSGTFSDVIIEGNILDTVTSDGAAADGIQVSSTDRLIIRGNILRDVKRRGVYLPTECANVLIDGNIIHNTTPDQANAAIAAALSDEFDHGSIAITNNKVSGKQGSNDGIVVFFGSAVVSQSLTLQNNTLLGTGAANNRAVYAPNGLTFATGIVGGNVISAGLSVSGLIEA